MIYYCYNVDEIKLYKFRQVKKTGEYREVVCKSYSDSSYWLRAYLKKYEIIKKQF